MFVFERIVGVHTSALASWSCEMFMCGSLHDAIIHDHNDGKEFAKKNMTITHKVVGVHTSAMASWSCEMFMCGS